MNLESLQQLVSEGESDTLEFKKSTTQLKGAAETLCAFLNGKGGTVIIGISDKGEINGQHVTDKTRQEIANVLRKFEPMANIDTNYIDLIKNDKKVILLIANPDRNSVPYTFHGRAYERNETTTHIMQQTRYQQILMNRNMKPYSWEDMLATGVTYDDLDHEEILRTLQQGISVNRIDALAHTNNPMDVLKRLALTQDGRITNAAVVLFCKELPGNYFQCVLRMARFKGIEKRHFIDSTHVFGNAFHILEEAERFIIRNTAIASHFEEGNFQRIDEPEYPHNATREALLNAICHRDYADGGGSITMAIYDDRLEISSHGTLPNGITIDELTHAHTSKPRNKHIANVFFRRGLIESFGIGTQEIMRACEDANTYPPSFVERGSDFVVILKSKHYVPVKDTTKELTQRQQHILEILSKHSELSPQEILNLVEPKIAERTLRNDLQELKSKGYIGSQGKGPKTLLFVQK